jgi:succinylarginine dihydrolase
MGRGAGKGTEKEMGKQVRKPALEANFDGLVGPTHNYAGLSHGNVASQANGRRPANPRQAALQGLEKMRRVAEMGVAQVVLPPQNRPDLGWLRRLGFAGKDDDVIAKAAVADPILLSAAWSASAMWTANSATFSPSVDSADGKPHITPANLRSQVHRCIEPPHTAALLKAVFPGKRFAHHDPLPSGRHFGDEGAANHIRLAPDHGSPGIQIFVYGHEASLPGEVTRRFTPRQSLEASMAVARLHGLDPDRTVFAAQNPAAIDMGVFHNDVISVGNGNVLFCHESAFQDRAGTLSEIRRKYAALGMGELKVIEVRAREVSLATAVSTYLFNSQILTLPSGSMLLLAAEECRRHPRVRKYLDRLPGLDLGITEVTYADLRQSMRNGGGPACLRLRAVLTPAEWDRVPTAMKLDEPLYERLRAWVEAHYRDRLLPKDLADPSLLRETRRAMIALERILDLASSRS